MSEFTNPDIGLDSATPAGGFNFENVHRNALIEAQLQKSSSNNSNKTNNITPLATKTGTTIVGLVYKNGIVLGADTRSTNDTTVADKNCEKIH